MIDQVRRALLLFLIFSISIQTGLHFWPDYSLVSGIRVDYLSPTLYFSDILISFLIILEIPSFISRIRLRAASLSLLLLYFSALLILPFFYAEHIFPHLMGVLQFFKFLFVGWLVSRCFSLSYVLPFHYILTFALFFQSVLSLLQFFYQRSLGSVFYFFGERMIDVNSYGAATFSFFGGDVLRPYGTFPHPNVLAFFLFFCLVFLVLWQMSESVSRISYRLFVVPVICIGSIALFLTFSRVIIFCYLVFLFTDFLRHRKYWLGILFPFFILYFIVFFSRFTNASFMQDIFYRMELFLISVQLIFDSYAFGMGINNFFYEQFFYHIRISPTFLQPVHNIYLLVVLHLGILGLGGFLFFVYKSFVRVLKKYWGGYPLLQKTTGEMKTVVLMRRISALRELKMLHCMRSGVETYFFSRAELFIFIAILFVGVFDHFFLTLQQGQLMFAVLLGLVWSRI